MTNEPSHKETSSLFNLINSKDNFKEADVTASFDFLKAKKSELYGLNGKKQVDIFLAHAKKELSIEKFIEFLFHCGKISLSRSQFQNSTLFFKEIIRIVSIEKEYENILPDSFLSLAAAALLHGDLIESEKFAKKGLKFFLSLNDNTGSAKCENILASVFSERGMCDLAKEHLLKSISHLENSSDYSFKGKLDLNLGILYHLEGDYYSAINSFRRSISYFATVDDHKMLSELRYNLGVSLMKSSQYQAAIIEFDLSIKSGIKSNNNTAVGSAYIAKSYLCRKLGDKTLARVFKEKAFKIFYKNKNETSFVDRSFNFIGQKRNDNISLNFNSTNYFASKLTTYKLEEIYSYPNNEAITSQNYSRRRRSNGIVSNIYGSSLYLQLDSHLLNFQYN